MPFSKSYLQSYLGNDFIQSVFNQHLRDAITAYENDLANETIEPDYTLTQYIEDYITNDMGFVFNNDLDDLTEDIMYKQLGTKYKTLEHIYDTFVNYANRRWPSYNMPSLPSLITRITFWEPLHEYVYQRINGGNQ